MKNKLNIAEQKGYDWLKKKFDDKDIIRVSTRCPDFYTTKGDAFECKKLYANTLLFRKKQYNELNMIKNCKLLLFKDDCNEPSFIINIAELNVDKHYKNLQINWI